jgi:hypothetical protein
MGKATSAVHSCSCHAGDHSSISILPRTTNGVFDLLRFVAATITLAIGDWAKSLLITIGTGGLPLYSMLNAGF